MKLSFLSKAKSTRVTIFLVFTRSFPKLIIYEKLIKLNFKLKCLNNTVVSLSGRVRMHHGMHSR